MPFRPGILLLGSVLLTLLLGCEPAPASGQNDSAADAPPAAPGPNAALIRNPVDAGTGEVDTSQMARMTFPETEYDFGEVAAGTVVTRDFPFVNTGSVPLLITKARSTCGCTVPDYPETPIEPGEKGVISVAFDTKNKHGLQRKPVTITANTSPSRSVVYVTGIVINDN